MKKIKNLFYLMVCALLSVSASACSDDDNEPDGGSNGGGGNGGQNPPVVVVTPTDNVEVVASYHGDYNENGTGNFMVNFVTKSMVWDENENTYIGPGKIVYIEFNSALCDNPDQAGLTAGTYLFDENESYDMNTFSASVREYDAAGNETEITVSGGTLTIGIENDMYVISADFILSDGSHYEYSFVGIIKFLNRTGEGYMSNLTGDIALADMTQSALIFWGETFTETSDYCSVIIAGDDYDLLENYGSAPAINLGLNITPGSTEIPSGIYNVINAMEADDYAAFTTLSGVYESAYGGYFGCWYFYGQTEGAMLSGKVTVENNGNGNYTFDIDLADGYGHKVTGIYTGTPQILE